MSNEVVVRANHGNAMMLDKEVFDQAYRAARLFAASSLVPAHFQGKEANCFIGLMVANRMGEDPLTVLQNMYVVSGKPGWSTQYMIARAANAGVFKGRIVWESTGKGDALSVTAKATLADTGEAIAVTADMVMAKAEGWTKNAKYHSMPEHMLRWRSAAMLIRLYCPEVMLGYQTVEELETLPMKDVTPKDGSVADSINALIQKAEEQAEGQGDQEAVATADIEKEAEVATERALQDQEKGDDDMPLPTLSDIAELPEKTLRDLEVKAKLTIRLIGAGEDKATVLEAINAPALVKRLKDAGRGQLADKLLAA